MLVLERRIGRRASVPFVGKLCRIMVMVALIAASFGCGESYVTSLTDGTGDPAFRWVHLSPSLVLTTAPDSHPVDSVLPEPITVQVLDENDVPFSGLTVEWTVNAQDGGISLAPSDPLQSALSSQLDASGRSSIFWRLGTVADTQVLMATVVAPSTASPSANLQTTVKVKGNPGPPLAMTVTPASLTLDQGGSTTLTADVVDRHNNPVTAETVEWTSMSPHVATVDESGTVTGVAAGQTYVLASFRSVRDSALVEVVASDPDPEPIGTLQVTPSSLQLQGVGSTAQLSVVARNATGAVIPEPTLRYASSSPAVIVVSSAGLVTAAGVGSAQVTVSSDCCTSASVSVSVLQSPNQAPTATIDSPSNDVTVALGQSVSFGGHGTDPDGFVGSHAWDFGDGNGSSVENPGAHTYAAAGAYAVTYRVVDDDGAISPAATRIITVSEAEPTRIVIFEDDFETGDLSRWDDVAAKYSVTSQSANVRAGQFALQARPGDFGELNKWFMPGYSDVTVEFDVKFQDDFQNLRSDGWGMHFFGVLGNHVDNRWSAHGQAGVRPDGTDFFVTVLDMVQYYQDPTPRPFMFYTNYPDMSCGGSACYGNVFPQSSPAADLVPGVWYHVKIRLKANTPGMRDGVQELWIDGVQKINATGMRWRDTDDVRVNEVAVWNYMPGSPTQYLWMDNVVVWRPE